MFLIWEWQILLSENFTNFLYKKNYRPTVSLYYEVAETTSWIKSIAASHLAYKQFCTFQRKQQFITMFTWVPHCLWSWAGQIWSTLSQSISINLTSTTFSHLHLGLPNAMFPAGFPTKILYKKDNHGYYYFFLLFQEKCKIINMYTYADPWMLQSLWSCNSLWRVDCQHLVDQVFCFWCYCIPFGWGILEAKT